MSEALFTREHEWVRVEGDVAVCGISDYAQEQLGDIVFVELPAVGRTVKRKEETAVVESVKAASEIYAPVSGEVVEVNEALGDAPDAVNRDPMGAGWFFKLKLADTAELGDMMDGDAYAAYVESLD